MFWQSVAALTPMVCVSLLFWFAMRAVVHADRREREAILRLEAEEMQARTATKTGSAD